MSVNVETPAVCGCSSGSVQRPGRGVWPPGSAGFWRPERNGLSPARVRSVLASSARASRRGVRANPATASRWRSPPARRAPALAGRAGPGSRRRPAAARPPAWPGVRVRLAEPGTTGIPRRPGLARRRAARRAGSAAAAWPWRALCNVHQHYRAWASPSRPRSHRRNGFSRRVFAPRGRRLDRRKSGSRAGRPPGPPARAPPADDRKRARARRASLRGRRRQPAGWRQVDRVTDRRIPS
jgi:hypothetical protein